MGALWSYLGPSAMYYTDKVDRVRHRYEQFREQIYETHDQSIESLLEDE